MQKYHTNILIFSLLLIIAQVCYAQDERGMSQIVSEKETSNIYAIIIGISDYKEVEDLKYADQDALGFASFLMSETGGTVDAANISILLNEEATAVNIGNVLDYLAPKIKEGDRLILFFAGHGDIEAANQNNGLLLLHKAPKSSYFSFGDEYLKVSDIRGINQFCVQNKAKAIIITDACRSGHLAGGSEGSANTSLALSEKWANEIKILSCQPNEISLEGSQWGGGHGVFTYYLVNGLYGLADQDGNEQVSLLELDSYLKTNVIREASPALQTPFVQGDLRSTLSVINKEELVSIKEQLKEEIPLMAMVNTKGTLDQLKKNPDTLVVLLYEKYHQAVDKEELILPEGSSAYDLYQEIENKVEDEHVINTLKRNLAASLQDKAMEVILPILKLEKFDKKPIDEYRLASNELKKAIELLGEGHYLTKALKIRSLFLEAYALSEEYNKLYADRVHRDSTNLILANEILYEAIEIDSTAAYPYFLLGWNYIYLKEITKAIEIFTQYTELIPNNKRAYNNLGYAYDEMNDTTNALLNYRKSIELDSSFSQPYGNIGFIYANAGNMKLAENYFRLSVEKDSMYVVGYYNLGLVYLIHRNLELAKTQMLKVVELNPNYFYAHFNLACIYSLESNTDDAITYLKEALDLGFDDFYSIKNDSDLENLRSTKEFKKLIKDYRKK